jgi:hypothetical protein
LCVLTVLWLRFNSFEIVLIGLSSASRQKTSNSRSVRRSRGGGAF